MKIAFAFLMCHLAGLGEIHAQPVSLGVEAGVPVTESFDTGFIYRGAFRLSRCALEAVSRPSSVRSTSRSRFWQSNVIGTPSSLNITGNLWQFPVLLKCRILEGPIEPYITAGPSVDRKSVV